MNYEYLQGFEAKTKWSWIFTKGRGGAEPLKTDLISVSLSYIFKDQQMLL